MSTGSQKRLLLAVLYGVACLSVAAAPPKVEPFRKWTSVSGKSVEARLLGVKDGRVRLELKTGKALEIKQDYLCMDDQEYLSHVGEPAPIPSVLSRQTLDMIVVSNVDFKDAALEQVLGFIEKSSVTPGLAPKGVRTGVHESVDLAKLPTISLRAEKLTLLQLLDGVADQTGLKYYLVKDTLVFTGQGFVGEPIKRTYKLNPGSLGLDFAPQPKSLLLRLFGDQGIEFPEGTDVAYDPATRTLSITHTAENVAKVDRLLARMVKVDATAVLSLNVYKLSAAKAKALSGFMSIQPGFGGRVETGEEMTRAIKTFRAGGVPAPGWRLEQTVRSSERFSKETGSPLAKVSFTGSVNVVPGGASLSLTFGIEIKPPGDTGSVTTSGTADVGAGESVIVLAHSGLAGTGDTNARPLYYLCQMTVKKITAK